VKPFYPPPYVTPKCPTGPKIVGVEVIVEVTITESCKTIDSTSTVTETVTIPCATKERPIYDVETSGLPCYVCAMSSEGISCPTSHFLTVSTTACPSCSGGLLPTYAPPVVYTSSSCSGYTLTNTEIITPGASAYTYPAIPYPTVKPHEHQETTSTTKVTAYATHSVYGVPSGSGMATYKATGTGSATPYKPTSSITPFTGGVSSNAVAFSALVGGAVLALVALL